MQAAMRLHTAEGKRNEGDAPILHCVGQPPSYRNEQEGRRASELLSRLLPASYGADLLETADRERLARFMYGRRLQNTEASEAGLRLD